MSLKDHQKTHGKEIKSLVKSCSVREAARSACKICNKAVKVTSRRAITTSLMPATTGSSWDLGRPAVRQISKTNERIIQDLLLMQREMKLELLKNFTATVLIISQLRGTPRSHTATGQQISPRIPKTSLKITNTVMVIVSPIQFLLPVFGNFWTTWLGMRVES